MTGYVLQPQFFVLLSLLQSWWVKLMCVTPYIRALDLIDVYYTYSLFNWTIAYISAEKTVITVEIKMETNPSSENFCSLNFHFYMNGEMSSTHKIFIICVLSFWNLLFIQFLMYWLVIEYGLTCILFCTYCI